MNALGQVIRKGLGHTNSIALQTVNYSYNIRGWLSKINDINLSSSTDGDLFGMRILYEGTDNGLPDNGDDPPNNTGFIPQFNGNISGIRWENFTYNQKLGYEFHYDDLNRVLKSNFTRSINSQWTLDDSFNEWNYDYDLNGNILSVKRNGVKADETTGLIDDLDYIYIGNQLVAVNDLVSEFAGYDFCDFGESDGVPPDPPLELREFFYDDNGNMITDRNKGIIQIDYNELNLPAVIDIGNNNLITYVYSALGEKLQVNLFKDGDLFSSVSYANGFIYDNAELGYILWDEGRILKLSEGFVYEYYLKDHLGNIRVAYTDVDQDGNPEIRQERSYYSFGLEMPELSFDNPLDERTKNKYQYNSKEFQNDFNLQWYDYGARFYDPQLGRWHVIDPLAEKNSDFSPYVYCDNNPVKLIDPNGMEAANGFDWSMSIRNTIFRNIGDAPDDKTRDQAESNVNTPVNQPSGPPPSEGVPGEEDKKDKENKNFAQGQGGNSLYAIGVGINAAGFVSSAGEYSNVINGSWRGVNGKWNSLEWGGNQWTGARANALSKAGYFKLASRGLFVVGTGISLYQGGDALLKGDYAGAAKSGLDIGMGAFATFGGPPGWIIGGGYFALDALGAFDRPIITTPYSPPMYAVPDNTYVAPPVIFPLR